MKMYKQIYSKDGNKAVYIVVRFGKWMATDQEGVIKDKIYILPSLAFYFNHSEFHVRFGLLNFEFLLWYNNYKRYDEYILKSICK